MLGLLNYDFSHIGAPISEFLFSFYEMGVFLSGSAQPLGLTRRYLLKGFPKRIDSRLRVCKACDEALGQVGAEKPSTIEAAGHASDVWWFSQELCQAFWFMDRILAKHDDAGLQRMKQTSARNLKRYLDLWGF